MGLLAKQEAVTTVVTMLAVTVRLVIPVRFTFTGLKKVATVIVPFLSSIFLTLRRFYVAFLTLISTFP